MSTEPAVSAVFQGLALVGLGANLGDAQASVWQAIAACAQCPDTRCLGWSSAWRTAPVDAQGPDFVNAVAVLETTLAPLQLLDALQAIEQQHGRERPYRNAPRTLDLDLLALQGCEMAEPRLTLPHPRMFGRAFVLAPLLELCPTWVWPKVGPLEQALLACQDQALHVLPGAWPQPPAPQRAALAQRLQQAFAG
ncbi:2-amino-4-hydroxy-6-hydroxymethyldihydropteridine diphosphokinase [Roseateles sp. BYS180W]|uniref:2-amino-4-hydroxy-6-hydroxymethyldihydropteridine pyrophosphokinase n=1 Tax=Roseateles rivi TaxID=3299028 RepID=A0ABW7FYQ2_9BURK